MWYVYSQKMESNRTHIFGYFPFWDLSEAQYLEISLSHRNSPNHRLPRPQLRTTTSPTRKPKAPQNVANIIFAERATFLSPFFRPSTFSLFHLGHKRKILCFARLKSFSIQKALKKLCPRRKPLRKRGVCRKKLGPSSDIVKKVYIVYLTI